MPDDTATTQVRILAGKRGARTVVRGDVHLDPYSGFVRLSSLVPGGDGENIADRYRRFRTWLGSGPRVYNVYGSGMWFHPNLLIAFIDKFGDGTPHGHVRAHVAEWTRSAELLGQRSESDRTGVQMDANESREFDEPRAFRDGVRATLKVMTPSKLVTFLQAIGHPPVHGTTTAIAKALKDARVRFHPDRQAQQSADQFQIIVCEEVFKELGRRDM